MSMIAIAVEVAAGVIAPEQIVEPMLMYGALTVVGVIISAAASIAGSVVGAQALKDSARAEKAAAEYNAQVVELEAARKQAADRRAVNLELARERASIAKLGIRMDEGTPLMILAHNAGELERTATEERLAARREANYLRMGGSAAVRAAKTQATATLIGGFGQAASTLGTLGGSTGGGTGGTKA